MENKSMSNNKNNQNTQSYHTPHFNPYHYYPPYHYLPNYTEQNNYNIDNLYKNINSLKKDILHLQSLYYHDRMDINIANHYIDSSVKEINKLKFDINQMKNYYDNKYKIYDNRINNAFRKISRLEHNNKNKNDEQNDSSNIETRIIRINGESNNMPLFPLLSMLGENMKKNTNEKNDLLDSEDEYDENINLYEINNNEIDDDIIEIDMNINSIEDLIKIEIGRAHV